MSIKNIKEYNSRRKCIVLIDQREQGTIINLRWNKPRQCFLVNFGAQIIKMLDIQANFGVKRSFRVIKVTLRSFFKKNCSWGLIFASLVRNYSTVHARKLKLLQVLNNYRNQQTKKRNLLTKTMPLTFCRYRHNNLL